MEIPIQQTGHRAWDLDTFDIKPPDSVLCAEFERLQIRFDFCEIHKKAKRATIGHTVVADNDVNEVMLLELNVDFSPLESIDELTKCVKIMGDLPSMIEQCFQPLLGSGVDPDLLQQYLSNSSNQDLTFAAPDPVQRIAKSDVKSGRGQSRRHPQAAIEILGAWLQAHADKPYPSKDEKSELARKTGLSKS
jgi:hypothetical protein